MEQSVELTIPDFNLKIITESGQCFRMRQIGDNAFCTIAGRRFVKIEDKGSGKFVFSCAEGDLPFWTRYFDLDTDYGRYISAVDPEDSFLQRAMEYARGLRILRQDPWEVAVSFVISQRKSVGAIKTSVEALCRCFGTPFETGIGTMYTFPTPEKLAASAIDSLRDCSVGYRDKYIKSLAQSIHDGAITLDAIAAMDDENAKKALCTLYGIGSKVADCILLFGFNRRDAFPVDVWIARILEREYNGSFPKERYEGFAGILQQYMFCYARSAEYGYQKLDRHIMSDKRAK